MTHKTDPNDFAFAMPGSWSPSGDWHAGPNHGLTKRELFALHAKGLHEDASAEIASSLTGVLMPQEPRHDYVVWSAWWIKVDAIVKVMQADALIAALNGEVND